nr:tail fiber [uncultured Mediterranean phage uvMED]
MANSFVRYTGNNSTTSYSIPFSYRATEDLTVTLAGVATTAFTLNAAGTTLTFNTAPANSVAIEIRRKTSQTTRLTDYADGSVLTENDLDTDSTQAFFMGQEAIDDANDVIKPSSTNFQWDATSKRIINVTNPVDNQDVATKHYLENTWLSSADKTTLNNVNSNIAAINTVNSNMSAITTTNSNATNINLVATNMPSVTTVATDIAKVIAVANDLAEAVSEVETVADDLNETTSEIDTVANAITNVDLVGNSIANVNTVAGLNTEIVALYAIRTDISGVNTISADVTAVKNISSGVTTLANITNLTNLANAHAAVSTVSTNLAAVQNFADVYRISATAPTSSLNVGDLYFDTNANELKVYKASGWAAAGSTINGTSQRFNYTATSGQTTFTGADTAGNTLAYDAGFADVYLNGVRLSAADITITSGTSVVLASAAAAGDILDVVGYGTFNVAAVAGSAINSGTINDARLPTTMAGKTLTTATVTGTINANTLVARGDGSSADGKITLNCSQNSHGVSIASPAHSAGQSYNLILPTSVGTNGQVLATNGSATNQLSWVDAQETKPTITSSNFYISPSTSQTFTINGTNFVQFPKVEFISSTGVFTPATAVSYTSATALSVTVTLGNGAYRVKITNPDGNAGISGSAICNASSSPTWSTAQALGSFAGNFSGTLVTLSASSDSTITYSEVGSNLTTGNMTLSGANITTTDFGGSSTSPTQYSFTIRATDAEGQYLDRAFTINSTFGATGGGQFN